MLSFPVLCLLVPHQGSTLDLLGSYNALETSCWFLHVFSMTKGLRPFTNSIWNTKMVVWQSALKNPCPPPPPPLRRGLKNFELVYFPGAELFWNCRGEGYTLGKAVSPRGDLVLFTHKLQHKQLIYFVCIL